MNTVYRAHFAETIGPAITEEIFAIIKAKCSPMEAVEVLSNVLRHIALMSDTNASHADVSKMIITAVTEALGGVVLGLTPTEPPPPVERPS